MTKISIITPAHNEEENIGHLCNRVFEALKKYNLEGELVVIDDGSTDRTLALLKELQKNNPRLLIIENPRRSGITYAVRLGFEKAKGDIFIFPLPADLESDPMEDFPKLLGPLKEGYDMSIGWRQNRTDSGIKQISTFIFNATVRILFGISLHDLGWVRAAKRIVIEETEPMRSDWHRFFALFAQDRGFKIKEVKLNFYPRVRGVSKFGKTGFGRILGAFADLLSVKFLITFSKKPMRIFGTTGAFFFFLGVTGGMYLFYLKLSEGSIATHTPLLFLVALLVTTGIQLFAFGFLAEMTASLKDKIK